VTRRIRLLTTTLQVLALGIAAFVSVGWLWRSVDVGLLRSTLHRAEVRLVLVAATLVVPATFARAAYWNALLGRVHPVRYRLLLGYTIACNAANVVLPARAGDGMRVWLLRTRHAVPLPVTGAVVATEKVGDLAALGLLVAPLPWLLPGLPAAVGEALRLVLVGLVVLIGLLGLASRYSSRFRWLAGLTAVGGPSAFLRAFRFVLVAWLLDLGSVLLVMKALGLETALGNALLVLLFVNLAIAVPASPGQLGTHELGSLAALEARGFPPEQALAFALLYHGVQLAPVLLMGLVGVRTTLQWRRSADVSP
jgi:uncharacterized membrane protein YbhN (UPF0104 family)